jgi:ketosteroid isomerase-like protein
MSEKNVELTRRYVEAWNARDNEAVIALCDPQIELDSFFSEVGGVYYGHDGVRRYFRDLEDAWGDELRVEPEAYFDLGEHTLAFNVAQGRGRHSGAEVARSYAQVVRWREGLMVYVKGYAHREEALRDLGVSEGELEPIAP